MAETETSIVQKTLLALQRLPLRVWRNNTGQAWMGKAMPLKAGQVITARHGDVLIRGAHPVRFGLPGSSDVLGLVGPSGRFLAVECKTLKGEQHEQQEKFQAMVERFGGVYVLVRDPATAVDQVFHALVEAGETQIGERP